MFSYFENRKTTYFDVFCLNFSIETKIKTLFLISYFNLSKKTKWHFRYTIDVHTEFRPASFRKVRKAWDYEKSVPGAQIAPTS